MADHLFSPDSPPRPLRIEYHGPLYDRGSWDEFPIRSGWKSESGTEKFRPGTIPQEFHSGIECWLYFGMLHYVFGDQLDQSDFLLRDNEGPQQYITTKYLQKYVDNVKDWKKKKLGERSVDIVKKVCEQLPKYTAYVRANMCLAIRLACHALWSIAIKRDGPQAQPAYVRPWMFIGANESEQMVKDGWCPLDVEKCRMAGGEVDTPSYLLQLVRTKPGWNKITHESCKKTECVANNIDESSYMTRHVQEDCSCSHLQADVEQLHTILQDGGIPLVMITSSGEGNLDNENLKIEIVRRRAGKRYVAISHVWSDGLGNTEGNSLPCCQLQVVYEQARRLLSDMEYVPRYDNGPFGPLHTGAARLAHYAARRGDGSVLVWIDTLCIPHQRDVRSLAIQRIRDVYVGAYRTMILDSEMKQAVSGSTSHLELLLRVLYCSGWVRRLWTLQEGLAAKSRLYVLFSDRAINISTIADELLTKLDRGKIPILQERIARFAGALWYSFFQHSIEYASKFQRVVDVVASPFVSGGISQDLLVAWNWFNVATRASSKAGDRPIVLAGVLNLDVKELLEVKGADERMRKFYNMLDGFPQDVLFQDGPRFEEDGMRWAMKVCQYTEEVRYLAHGAGKITPRGLQITLSPSWQFPSRMVFDLRHLDLSEGQMAWEKWVSEAQLEEDRPANVLLLKTKVPIDFKLDETYGIIVRESKASRPGSMSPCALVSLQTTEDEVHYARYNSVGTIQSIILGVTNLPEEGYLVGATWDNLQKHEWIVG